MIARPKNYYKILKNLDGITNRIFKEAGIKPKLLRVIEGGYSDDVALFVADGKKEYFLKIGFQDSIANEIYWYEIAKKYNIKTPKLLFYDLSKEQMPFIYEILEHVSASLPYNLSQAKMYEAGHFAGKELRKIHRIRVKGFGSVDTNFKWKYKTWLDALKDERRLLRDSFARKIFSQKEIETVDTQTIYNKELNIRNSQLIHGDLYEDNVLYIPKSKKFIITDPGSLIGGDPMYDLAYSTVPRSEAYENGIKAGYKLSDITEKERHRFRMLRIFCLFKEATEYAAAKDARLKINRLVKALRSELY